MDDKPAAIDITWGTGLCYFGIPFQTDWIADLLKQRAAIGSTERQVLSERCQLSLRILRDGLKAGMVRGGFDVSAQPNG